MRRILIIGIVLLAGLSLSAQVTWEKKNGPYGGDIADAEIAPGTSTLMLLSGNKSTLYRSTNNGISWAPVVVTGQVNEYIGDIAIAGNGNMFAVSQNEFYKSVDDGITWTKISTGTSSLDGGFDSGQKILINAANNSIIMTGKAGSNSVVYNSLDGGVTWAIGHVYTGGPYDGLLVDAVGNIFAWRCCGTAKIYKSDDDGYNFSEEITGLGDISITSAAVTPDGANVYCANRNSVFKWNGTSWDDIGVGEGLATVGDDAVMASGTDGVKNYLFYGDWSNGILYRKDLTGTNNWVPQNTNFAVAGALPNFLRAKTHNQIYVGTREIGFFRSTNGGSTWISSNSGIEDHRFNDMVIANNESRIIVASEQSIYSSINEGGTWSREDISMPGGYNSIRSFVKLDNGEIYGYGSIGKKSVDNGATWTDITVPVTDIQRVINTDQTRFFAQDFNKKFYFTADKGVSWTPEILLSGLPAMLNYEDLTPGPNNTLFARIRDYDLPSQPVDLYQITFSPDPGTMTPTSGAAVKITTSTPGYIIAEDLSGVQYVNGVLYAYGRNASFDWVVCISNDNGASFTNTLLSESGYGFVVDRNGYIHMLAYDGVDQQSVYISRDNGVSFERTDVAIVNNGFIQHLKVGPVSGIAYALMEYKGLFKTTSTIVVPDAPINLVEVGRGKNGVSFRFDDDSNIEDGFVIQRQDMGIFVSIDTVGSNAGTGERRYFRDRNLTPGTVYNYRVAAYNSAGASAFVPISITTLAETTPSIPVNRSWTGMTQNIDGLATPGTNTAIAIKHLGNGRYSISDVSGGVLLGITGDTEVPGFFYESSGQTYFEIDFDFELLEEQNGTWDNVDEITLFWRLDKDGNGGPYPDKYEQISLTLNSSDPVPAAPSDVLTYVYSNTSIEVSWIGTAFEEEFLIDRSTAPGGPFTNVGSIPYPATSYIDADPTLAFSQTYYYQVRGSNITGPSAPSATSAGVTFNPPNFVLTNSEVTNNSQGLSTGFIWGDYDNDGDEDLILVQITLFTSVETTPYAYKNNGDGTFTSVNTGFDQSGYISGAAADYNNDGNLDIFITSSTSENLLYQGNGDFTFTKVDPNQVGENIPDFERASLTASWVDYDNNGLLDLFVSNQDSEELLFSQTALDVFTKITTGEIVTFNSRTNTNAWADYDNDGDMDVFVLNNSDSPPSPNRLYKNNDDGTFTHVTGLAFDADLDAGAFGASWGDYDNDGDMDLFLAVQEGTANLLYRNNGAAGSYNFTKVTGSPVTNPITTPFFGSTWGDIDNDGDLDLLLAGVLGENVIYKGDGAGNFGTVTNEKFNDSRIANFGISLGDYDNDGFLDLALAALDPQIFGNEEFSGPGVNSFLFKSNQTSSASTNWLKVKLVGTTSNKSAIGARLALTAGGKTQIREITTSSGFGGQNSLIAHFGLGNASTITSLQIKWPSGIVQSLSNVTANQTLAITEDNTGPVPLSFSPANGGTGIATTATLQINLNEVATKVGGKLLKVYDAIDLVTPIHSVDVATAIQTGNSFTFTIPSKLNISTGYAVDVEAGAFKDVYNNDSPIITTSQWGFTTGAGPVPTVLLPAHNSTDISTATNLEITFGQATTAVAGKNLSMFESTNLTTPVFTFDVTTAALSGNTYTFTLPSKLNLNTIYVVDVDAGAFIDVDANDSPEILKSQWGFQTSAGPSFVLLSPAHASSAVALAINLEITFNSLTTPVSGKNILLFDAADLTTAVETIAVTTGMQTGNKHSFTLTTTLGGFTTYTIGIGSGAFIDANQNDFAGLAPGNWTFTTLDNVAPQVTFTPPATANKGFGTATYSTGATDNSGTVASVVLSHRKIFGGAFTDVAGTFNSGTSMWDFTIAETAFDESGLEYFITATDAANNAGRLPESPTEYFHTYLLFGGDNIAKIPNARLGFGGALANWKIFSIPFDLGANNSIVGVFDELSSKEYKTEWRFISYQNTTSWLEYPTLSTIDRGKGYFINIKNAVEIALADNLQAPTNNRSNLFQMTLKQGWNQIGNPYLSSINWSDVSTFNSLTGTAASLKTYASSAYVNATSLQPYEGGFVFVGADITISIPFAGQIAPGGRANNISSDLSEEDWMVPLVLQQHGVINELSGIGMNHGASISMDDFDDVNPPRFINFLEMNFSHPDHFAKRFSKDVVPTQNEFTWDFTIASNLEGMVTLHWDNSNFGSNQKDLFLVDIEQQQPIDMRLSNSYTFDASLSEHFKVHFGENLKTIIQPERIVLGKAYPNPTNSIATIPFTLPPTSGTYHVRLEVYDMMGRKIDILQNGMLPSGFYESRWDVSNGKFRNGLYTYRLMVAGDDISEVFSEKLILNK